MKRLTLTGSLGSVRSRNGRLRASVVVAYADKPIKGFRFSREALAASIPIFVGDPAMLGNHVSRENPIADYRPNARNPVVGRIYGGEVQEDGGLRLFAEFDDTLKPALQQRGMERLEDLSGEVSMETVNRVLSVADGITEAAIDYTNGFVLLTDTTGACSRADGCGLVLAADAQCCAECAERETEAVTKLEGDALDQMKTLIADAVKEAVSEAKATDGSPAEPKGTSTPEPSDKEKAYDEIMAKRRESLVDALVETGKFKDSERDDLAKSEVAELERLLKVAQPAESEERQALAAEGGRVVTGLFAGRQPTGSQPTGGETKDLQPAPSHEAAARELWKDHGGVAY